MGHQRTGAPQPRIDNYIAPDRKIPVPLTCLNGSTTNFHYMAISTS